MSGARWFLFPDSRGVLLSSNGDGFDVPECRDTDLPRDSIAHAVNIGTHGGFDYRAARIGGDSAARPGNLFRVERRVAPALLDSASLALLNRAYHLVHWYDATRFCGRCGDGLVWKTNEIARECPACGQTYYPQIAPAVIVAVVRDGTLLMAHNIRHPGHLRSVLAGFVEAGETLEQTVAREVYEESGVLVKNIEYFSSQPWPYPGSLMVAFTAEYAGGTARPADQELVDVRWYKPSDLPGELPAESSVARRLIEWFVASYGSERDLVALTKGDNS